MGKINNMYNNQDEISLKYINRLSELAKPKLKIKGIKDIATLIGPNAKNYKITKNQKRFQRNARVSIAVLAASMAIASGTITNMHHSNPVVNNSTDVIVNYSSKTLSKDVVMENAENKIKELVYGDNFEENHTIDNISFLYDTDKIENVSSVKLTHTTNLNKYEDFSYSSGSFLKKSGNAKEIDMLLDKMIEMNDLKDPSNKDLIELNTLTGNLDDLNIKFSNGKLILNQEKDMDEAR